MVINKNILTKLLEVISHLFCHIEVRLTLVATVR